MEKIINLQKNLYEILNKYGDVVKKKPETFFLFEMYYKQENLILKEKIRYTKSLGNLNFILEMYLIPFLMSLTLEECISIQRKYDEENSFIRENNIEKHSYILFEKNNYLLRQKIEVHKRSSFKDKYILEINGFEIFSNVFFDLILLRKSFVILPKNKETFVRRFIENDYRNI